MSELEVGGSIAEILTYVSIGGIIYISIRYLMKRKAKKKIQ